MRWVRRVDERVMRAVTSAGCAALDEVMPRASRVADQLLVWWLIAGTLRAGGGRRSRRAAARAALAMSVAGTLANGVRIYVFHRERPPEVLSRRRPGRVPDSPGFPSGHSAGAAAFATTLVCEAPRRVSVPVAALASLVAYSRVYTGAHYPGDVAAGAATGVAVALAVHGLFPAEERR
ncbi:phosphatase PAP2 family protein [Actinoallomurus rhizosphaericola]|uniref:phosphatase PAP2 family protein n=1 Tax=Actinoallomurus rhizosphaericola TaxID=2952536 RepID=UPI002093FD32|nr:phosphatase PAP2 family protein [Actinoallomurus rhizosphaericola]MCO5997840.1 phosphatase PAP2 family protein [Actinoallomurus rhizosphaericola]